MALENPFIPLITRVTFLLLTLTSANANHSNKCSGCYSDSLMHQSAKDVIYMGGREVRRTIEFAHTIPKLKSFQQNGYNSNELVSCTVGLENFLSDLQGVLNRMKRLKTNSIKSDTASLQGMSNQINEYNGLCNFSQNNDVTAEIVSMMDRKLLDIAMMINDVVNVVDKLDV